jgi:hypothetical protein
MPGDRAAAARVAGDSPQDAGLDAATGAAARFDEAALAAAMHELSLAAVDPLRVESLMLDSPFSRVRQLAAERVAAEGDRDPERLKSLLHRVRGKDKSVYKILKQKCDALNAAQREALERAAVVESLCASLEWHVQRTYDAFYVSRFDELAARWRALSPPAAADTESRAVKAMERCREVIDTQRRLEERQAAERAAAGLARRAALEAADAARRAAADSAMASSAAQEPERQEAAARNEAEEAVRAQSAAAQRQAWRRVGGLIRKAREALDAGDTQRAAGLRRAVGAMRSPAPPEPASAPVPALPAHLARELQRLDADLDNFKAWKDYAVAPKRTELIEAMEQLIGAAEEPKELAARIKSLQAEWRTISRGIVSETPDEWERFHRASQAAYEPCREHFAAAARVRQTHLESRKALLERLTAFEGTLSSEAIDYRLLARVLREAQLEWRGYFPVDRDANREVQSAFDESIVRLQARYDAWREDNAAAKRALVTQARQLPAEDSRAAIDGVKKLQSLWREVGPAARDLDQALWTEFREICDAVFDKRRLAHAEFEAAIETNQAQVMALCETAEHVATLSGQELLDGVAKIPEWRAAFDAVSELPRSQGRSLERRFERAIASCAAQLAQLRTRDAEEAVAHLFAAARHVRAVEWAAAQGAPAAQQGPLREAAEAYIASVSHWPQGGLQAVKETLAAAASASDAGRDAREQSLRLLCIRAEVNAAVPTPAEDEALRREFQVQRLVRSIGQGPREEDRHEMMLEWVRIGAVSPTLYDELAERFARAVASGSRG